MNYCSFAQFRNKYPKNSQKDPIETPKNSQKDPIETLAESIPHWIAIKMDIIRSKCL